MAGEDGVPSEEGWACTLLFLPSIQTLLQEGVGSRGCSRVPGPVSSSLAASVNTSLDILLGGKVGRLPGA